MFFIEALYITVIVLLATYGFAAILFAGLHLRRLRTPNGSTAHAAQPTAHSEVGIAHYPAVTVQLPIYNERHVATRLIDAVSRFDWPASCLHIQILDDSTDDTTDIVRTAIEQYAPDPTHITHMHRTDRTGYKAGALQKGLSVSNDEFIAIFDADFVPPPNFLKCTIPLFDDPQVGCVQTRWGHLNAETSNFTLAQSLGIDGHFVVEQPVRSNIGAFLNFNGTAGIWRRTCLDSAGGWRGDTLTEDLDLSYRAQLAGWRIEYSADVIVPAEIPVQIEAFKRQQFRWAKGSIQTARKLGGRLATASEPLWRKVLGFLHLTNYAVHPLMLANLLLLLPITWSTNQWLKVTPILTIAALGPPLVYWSALSNTSTSKRGRIKRLAFLMALGTGISLSNTCAVLEALTGRTGVFQRTPKFAVMPRDQTWLHSSYALPRNPLVWLEVVLALYTIGMLCYCLLAHIWWIIPWVILYASGYTYVSTVTISQATAIRNAWRGYSSERSSVTTPESPPIPLSPQQ